MIEVKSQAYYWLQTWIHAHVIELGTQRFCERFLGFKQDPCGRMTDQMVQAARSGQANITEGSARRITSRETEMKLTDVARASLCELEGDYFNFLMKRNQIPWGKGTAEFQAVNNILWEKPNFGTDWAQDACKHILLQKSKFDTWIEHGNEIEAANCLLILTRGLIAMLNKQLTHLLEDFKLNGGFSENLTELRLAQKQQEALNSNAPLCPICNKPMIKRMAKKGQNVGKVFWACSDFPNCHGTRKFEG